MAMVHKSAGAFVGARQLLDQSVRDQMRLAWRLLRDERVSGLKYVLPALLTAYVLSPLDPIPDVLVGIGQMDDIGVVIALLMLTSRLLPKLAPADVVDEHLRAMGRRGRASAAPPPAAASPVVDATFRVRDRG
jgi:uncharacterized membrane protein YkvA (DUF1232 family)